MDPYGVTNYALARRAVLFDVTAGRVPQAEVCDAHPDLLRAARHGGTASGETCPICHEAELLLVTFAFGDRLGRRNGRMVAPHELDDHLSITGVRCFTVEVCDGCRWNHLVMAYVARERLAPPTSGSSAGDTAGEPPAAE